MPAILIDDLDRAMMLWPEEWRRRLGPTVIAAADEIRAALANDGWGFCGYEDYLQWLRQHLHGFAVISLDKLMPEIAGPAFASFELTRSAGCGKQLPYVVGHIRGSIPSGKRVVLVDDALYSGGSVEMAANELSRIGITVTHVFVGVAKFPNRGQRFFPINIPVSAMKIAPPEYDIVHFRDFFALLPFSGREIASAAQSTSKYRYAAALHRNGYMLALQQSFKLRFAVVKANSELVQLGLRELGLANLNQMISDYNNIIAWPVLDSNTDNRRTSIAEFSAGLVDWLSINSS